MYRDLFKPKCPDSASSYYLDNIAITSTEFLAFLESGGEIRIDTSKIGSVRDWPRVPRGSSRSETNDGHIRASMTIYPWLRRHCRALSFTGRNHSACDRTFIGMIYELTDWRWHLLAGTKGLFQSRWITQICWAISIHNTTTDMSHGIS